MSNQDGQRIILITGSTDGIGKQTALELARDGNYVLVHGRDEKKVHSVTEYLRDLTHNKMIEGFAGDFSSLAEVRSLANKISDKVSRLDVLINNAGILQSSYALSCDGHEMTFAVNHLAPFLLTNLLLDLIKKGHNSRIINVSSDVHSRDIDLHFRENRDTFDGMKEYSLSKLCSVLFTYKLARILEKFGITVNCLHPGVINTRMLIKTWGKIGSPVEEGAKTSVYLALSDEVRGVTGKYFRNKRQVRSAPVSYNRDVQDELWKFSEEIISLSSGI